MRVFAMSDLHVDHALNLSWVQDLSRSDYQDDVLILAGDVSHRLALLAATVASLARRFRLVLFVPGNHDLWVLGDPPGTTSLQKFEQVMCAVEANGAATGPRCIAGTRFVPLLGWYDYSFGVPAPALLDLWMDFRACRWPAGFEAVDIARHFEGLNALAAQSAPEGPCADRVITYSHFLPRIDLVPAYVPSRHRILDPVLGSSRLEHQLRALRSEVHVYGHSHINRAVTLEGLRYVNNALGYPQEEAIASRRLALVAEI